MEGYTIEKGVALPDRVVIRNRESKYPFSVMEVGDSIFFKDVNYKAAQIAYVRMYAKKSGRKFTVRTVEGGVRVWRIE